MAEIHVRGLKELQKFLDQLPVKIERNIMRGALRAGAKPILAQAIAGVPVQSGELKNSLKISTSAKGGTVESKVKTNVFYSRFVEFGTQAHFITAKKGGWLSFGGIFAKSVWHPGIPKGPHAFMRPALDSQAQAAVVATAEYIKKRLATKEGLDTSHIMIEGDE
jgi:HK97 gp10 family phage protein